MNIFRLHKIGVPVRLVLLFLATLVFASSVSMTVSIPPAQAQEYDEFMNELCERVPYTWSCLKYGTQEAVEEKVKGAGKKVLEKIGHMIGNLMLQIAAGFLYLGGMLLDLTIARLVLGMGSLISGTLEGSIDVSWKIIRDFSNLAFIFGFVWIGIKTIIDYSSANTKKFLASLIIAALLINFSLFITKAVIDVSNVLAVEIYGALTEEMEEGGLAENLVQKLGLVTFYDVDDFKELTEAVSNKSGGFTFFVMASIFFMVTGFVFAAGAFLLIIRFVALLLIMIFSPVLFAATVFGGTYSYSTKLWNKLFSYAFFAPLFFLFMLISFKLIDGITIGLDGAVGKDKTFVDALNGQEETFPIILVFVIITLFMIISLLVSKSLSIAGGQGAVNLGNRLRKGAQGYAGRTTVGWGANRLRKRADAFSSKARKSDSRLMRTAGMAARSRSVRGTLAAGEAAKFGSKYSYADDQKYQKEGRARDAKLRPALELQDWVKEYDAAKESGDEEKKEKAQEKIQKLVTSMNRAQHEEAGADIIKHPEVLKNMTSNTFDKLMESEEFNDEQKEEFAEKRKEAIKNMFVQNERVIAADFANASDAQLEALDDEFLEENAHLMTSSQIQGLEKSKKRPEKVVTRIKQKRKETINKWTKDSEYGAKQVFKNYKGPGIYEDKKPSEVAQLPKDALMSHNAHPYLTSAVLEQIADKKTLGHADRVALASALMSSDSVPQETKDYLDGPQGDRLWKNKTSSS